MLGGATGFYCPGGGAAALPWNQSEHDLLAFA
jgi:hypothetical protein